MSIVYIAVEGAESVREGAELGTAAFVAAHGRRPGYVMVRKIPKGAEEGDVLGDDLMLIEAEWVPEKVVVVAGVVGEVPARSAPADAEFADAHGMIAQGKAEAQSWQANQGKLFP